MIIADTNYRLKRKCKWTCGYTHFFTAYQQYRQFSVMWEATWLVDIYFRIMIWSREYTSDFSSGYVIARVWWRQYTGGFNTWYFAAAGLVFNRVFAPSLGRTLDPQSASAAETVLKTSLATMETLWLKDYGKFLTGSLQPSIADLSLACEVMQLQVCSYRFWQGRSTPLYDYS